MLNDILFIIDISLLICDGSYDVVRDKLCSTVARRKLNDDRHSMILSMEAVSF